MMKIRISKIFPKAKTHVQNAVLKEYFCPVLLINSEYYHNKLLANPYLDLRGEMECPLEKYEIQLPPIGASSFAVLTDILEPIPNFILTDTAFVSSK